MVKKGFSLAEALIVMAIVSVLFSLGAKVITTKPKPPKIEYPHGMFECILENVSSHVASVKSCHFEPPTGAVSYNIYIFIGNEKTETIIEPNITEPINIQISNVNSILQARISTTDNIYPHNMTKRWFNDINLETLLMLEHPESQMFNGGQGLLPGVLITW